MDQATFNKSFKGWLDLHPFKRDRDWKNIGPLYFQELGTYREVELTEALGRLYTKIDHFPSMKEVKAEIAAYNTSKTEGRREEKWTETHQERLRKIKPVYPELHDMIVQEDLRKKGAAA